MEKIYLGTISIVSHGHGVLLCDLLADLQRQERINQFLILLTLNIQTDKINVRDYPLLDLQIIENEESKGFGANHNYAFGMACGPIFCVLNPDIRISGSQALMDLIAPFSSNDQLALCAPTVLSPKGDVEDSVRHNLSLFSVLIRYLGSRAPIQPRELITQGKPFYWFAGMFLVIRAADFRDAGGFNEKFFLYCEDYDLCAKFYLAGKVLSYLPQVEVIHAAQRKSHRSLTHLRWHISSLIKVWFSKEFWQIYFNS